MKPLEVPEGQPSDDEKTPQERRPLWIPPTVTKVDVTRTLAGSLNTDNT